MAKSHSGVFIEVFNDWPDEMASVVANVYLTGISISGTFDESGKFKPDRGKKD